MLNVAGLAVLAFMLSQGFFFNLDTVRAIVRSFREDNAGGFAHRDALNALVYAGVPAKTREERARAALEMVELGSRMGHRPNELSGGMARRVALARVTALDPMLIMYDEPFAGLDPISMGVLVQLIKRLNEALGLTAVVVSHDIKETLSIADYVYVIADGQVMAEPAFKGSGDITSMANADGYVEIPASTVSIEAGTMVQVTLF